mgnify:CR=1 FL=1
MIMIKNCTRIFTGLLFTGLLFFSMQSFGQLSGYYTIGGTGANYATFTAAVNALSTYGVSGPVTFTVAAGTYNEQISISSITGASATNTITFDGVDKNTRILTYSASSTANMATVTFNACSYVTFKNLTINSTGSSYALGVYFAPYSTYNKVTNCNIVVPQISSTYVGAVRASGAQSSYSSACAGLKYNEVSYNYISGGDFTVVFYGNQYSGSYDNIGNKFNYNTVDWAYYYKLYWYYQGTYEVIGNKFTKAYGAGYGYPTYIYYCSEGKVNENFIPMGFYGLMLYYENYASGATSKTTEVYNNMIMDPVYTSYHYGIYAYYGYNLQIYHNSVWVMPGSSSTSYSCLYDYYGYYHKIKNNIFVNTGNGSCMYLYYNAIYSGDVDYNNYYSTGSYFVIWQGNMYNDINSLKSGVSNQNQNSVSQTPHFTNIADLHYSFGTIPKFAPYLSQVPKDIDLQNRNTTSTMLGADEQEFPDYDLDIISIVSPEVPAVGNNIVKIKFVNGGSKPIPAQTLYFSYQVNGGSWTNGTLTLTSPIQPFTQPIEYTFSTPWYIASAGTYTLTVRNYPQISGDPDVSDEISATTCTGFQGNYTIDAAGGGNFTNFTDAISQMVNCGVSGPVYFTVKAGTYGAFQLNEIKGVSATNTIKFIGEDKSKVIIQHAGSTTNDGLQANIRFNGADYITIANMTIINTGTSYGEGIHLINKSNYNTFENLDIKVASNTSTYILPLVGSGNFTSYSSQAEWGNYNTFKNVSTDKGYFGIVMYGPVVYNTFNHCTVENAYYYGMYLYYSTKTKVQYCKIWKFGYSSAYGIYSYYGDGDTIVGNYIEPGQYGIMSYYQNYYNQNSRSLLANNMITNFMNTQYQTGFYIYYNYYTQVVNNAVWVDGSYNNYSYAAILDYYYNYYTTIANNILISTNQTYLYSHYYPTSPSGMVVDYNVYYHTGTASTYFSIYGTGYSYQNFVARTAELGPHDQNSWYQQDPQVVGKTDLHLPKGTLGRYGYYVPGNKFDFDGDPRCALATFVGPDEPTWKVVKSDFVYDDTMCRQAPVTFYNTGVEKDPRVTKWFVRNVLKATTFHFTTTIQNKGYDTITLVQQTCASTDTITKRVFFDDVQATPAVEFMVSKNVVEVNEVVQLGDLSKNCPTEWEWEFNPAKKFNPLTNKMEDVVEYVDNTTATSQNPRVIFKFSGEYDVCLTAKNSKGTSPKTCKTGYINVKFSDNMCGVSNFVDQAFGVIYDDGGPTGNHGKEKKCTYLIKACGNVVDVTLSDFNLGAEAYLRLYDGSSNQGTPLWNPAYGPKGMTGNMNDLRFQSSFQVTKTGMLYVEFVSDVQAGSGFKLEWASSGKGSYQKPVASFDCADSGCIGVPFYYQNTSMADPKATVFFWDFNGNGIIDSREYDGVFIDNSFQGVAATYKTILIANNCAGTDTAEKIVTLINPQKAPTGVIYVDVPAPVANQDVVTLSTVSPALTCVNTWEWSITPSTFYFEAGTDKYSENPKIVFQDTNCYDISVVMGNKNTAWKTQTTKLCAVKPKTYCNAVVMNIHPDMGISRVKVGSIDNTSDIGVTPYSNFTNTTSTNLYMGQDYEITLERQTNFNKLTARVWIDWNNDGDMDDPGEEIAATNNYTGLSWTAKFTVPATASLGASMMRVSVGFGVYQNKPCGPLQFGEVEDYRVFISPDNEPPVITINGSNPASVEVGYPYTDDGAIATDNIMGNITNTLYNGNPLFTTYNAVKTDKMGTYFVYYNACDTLGNCSDARRTVYVTEDKTPPVITLIGGDPIYVAVNKPFVDTFFKATDLADGDITNKVQISGNLDVYKLGSYTRQYYVEDNAGLSDTKTRTIIVVDNAAPDIALIGDNPMYLEIMKPFTDPGVTYSDNYWPNNKIALSVSGLVDNTKIGSYTITYSVTDYSGNGPNSITRTVIVWDSTAPVIEAMGGDVIEHEVNTQFIDPGLNIIDNSLSGFTVTRWGSFLTKFPNEFPTKLGNFIIFYKVTDAAGNVSEILGRIIKVVDSKAPVLTLNGSPYVIIEKWDNYVDAGYTISDNYYDVGDLDITVDNTVNVHEPGLYHVCYQATDPSGNKTPEVCRIVKVIYVNTGVEEANSSKVSVYPNPTNGNISVDLRLPLNTEVTVSITDMMGREIVVLNKGMLKNAKFDVDLSNFSSGVYFVKVQTAENQWLEKIIKN